MLPPLPRTSNPPVVALCGGKASLKRDYEDVGKRTNFFLLHVAGAATGKCLKMENLAIDRKLKAVLVMGRPDAPLAARIDVVAARGVKIHKLASTTPAAVEGALRLIAGQVGHASEQL